VESDLLESLLNHDSPIDSSKVDSLFDEFSLPRPLEILSNDSFSQIPMEEIDLFLNDLIPPGIESDSDSEEDIIDNLLNDDPIQEYERLTFNIEPDTPVINNVDELNEDECFDPGE
ncbi:hypothetical protein Tco_0297055, partial [Tanacetum coccineum]